MITEVRVRVPVNDERVAVRILLRPLLASEPIPRAVLATVVVLAIPGHVLRAPRTR